MIERKEEDGIVFIRAEDITLRDLLRSLLEAPASDEIEIAQVTLGWKKKE